ncbi:MAG TPA: SusF/SusE family outer membrane protein [Prolixibacteraceae bacterium]|nr:SusF/SusE family outer membrane protein [Prolixibacteraceae bacterium]
MKHSINIFLGLVILLFSFAGCEDDPTITVLKKVSFTAPVTASVNQIVITEADLTSNVISLNWEKVDYYLEAPVTYTIQITTTLDTVTWANVYEMEVGNDVLTASITGEQLNTIVVDHLGMEPETIGSIAIRIKSYVDRNAFSKAVTVNVTPYKVFTMYPSLWVAGDYQGWDVTVAPRIVSVTDNGIYEGYIYIPAGGTNEFKVYAQADWNPISYGTKNDGIVIEADYAGDNFVAPSDGYYLFSIDLNNMTYLLIKMDWGLIGAATPGGWDADTEMTYNPGAQTWTVTADMKADGSFKFRANKAWQIDFGMDEEGNLAYANHPWLTYVERPQLTVPTDGNYTITLDLHDPGNYTYKIKKN